MGSDYTGMVIRPPMERIGSGKVFRPSSKLRNKYWLEAIVMGLLFYVITIGTFFGLFYFIAGVDGGLVNFENLLYWYWEPVNLWFWVANLCWLIPTIALIPFYLNTFEYSVRSESGEAAAEIFVKKGILTKTEKHVPIRSITNVATKVGVLDRVFGIGCVEIETAGYSGLAQEGPEEKISGITFFNELRDYILGEMRKFRGPNVLGTEADSAFDEPIPRISGTLDDEILITLREMRELLKSINTKLDRES